MGLVGIHKLYSESRMIKMTVYGYARVSTLGQDLKAQRSELIKAGVVEANIFEEKGSGATMNRPTFSLLLEQLHQFDELVVSKLDRLARNTREALDVIEELLSKDITITVLNLGRVENTPVGRMIYTILLSIAELERDMIIERTRAGKEYAKKNNPDYKEGRPRRLLTPQYIHAVKLLETHTYKEVSAMTNISKSTLQRIKKQYENESPL